MDSSVQCHVCNSRSRLPPGASTPASGDLRCPICNSEFVELVEVPRATPGGAGGGPTSTRAFRGRSGNVDYEVHVSTTTVPFNPNFMRPMMMSMPTRPVGNGVSQAFMLSMPMDATGLAGLLGGLGINDGGDEGFDRILTHILNAYQAPAQPTAQAVRDSLPRLRVRPAATVNSSTAAAASDNTAVASSAPGAADGSVLPPAPGYASCHAGEPCSVCHDTYVAEEQVVELPCAHCFHEACVMPWLDEHNTCPMCRYKLADDDEVAGSAHRQPENLGMPERGPQTAAARAADAGTARQSTGGRRPNSDGRRQRDSESALSNSASGPPMWDHHTASGNSRQVDDGGSQRQRRTTGASNTTPTMTLGEAALEAALEMLGQLPDSDADSDEMSDVPELPRSSRTRASARHAAASSQGAAGTQPHADTSFAAVHSALATGHATSRPRGVRVNSRPQRGSIPAYAVPAFAMRPPRSSSDGSTGPSSSNPAARNATAAGNDRPADQTPSTGAPSDSTGATATASNDSRPAVALAASAPQPESAAAGRQASRTGAARVGSTMTMGFTADLGATDQALTNNMFTAPLSLHPPLTLTSQVMVPRFVRMPAARTQPATGASSTLSQPQPQADGPGRQPDASTAQAPDLAAQMLQPPIMHPPYPFMHHMTLGTPDHFYTGLGNVALTSTIAPPHVSPQAVVSSQRQQHQPHDTQGQRSSSQEAGQQPATASGAQARAGSTSRSAESASASAATPARTTDQTPVRTNTHRSGIASQPSTPAQPTTHVTSVSSSHASDARTSQAAGAGSPGPRVSSSPRGSSGGGSGRLARGFLSKGLGSDGPQASGAQASGGGGSSNDAAASTSRDAGSAWAARGFLANSSGGGAARPPRVAAVTGSSAAQRTASAPANPASSGSASSASTRGNMAGGPTCIVVQLPATGPNSTGTRAVLQLSPSMSRNQPLALPAPGSSPTSSGARAVLRSASVGNPTPRMPSLQLPADAVQQTLMLLTRAASGDAPLEDAVHDAVHVLHMEETAGEDSPLALILESAVVLRAAAAAAAAASPGRSNATPPPGVVDVEVGSEPEGTHSSEEEQERQDVQLQPSSARDAGVAAVSAHAIARASNSSQHTTSATPGVATGQELSASDDLSLQQQQQQQQQRGPGIFAPFRALARALSGRGARQRHS